MAYNALIISQEETVFLKTTEEEKYYKWPNRYAIKAWDKISIKFDATTGYYKTRIFNKYTKRKILNVTRDPEYWITELELLRGELRKLNVNIYDTEMTTHISSNLPESYGEILENPEEKIDGNTIL